MSISGTTKTEPHEGAGPRWDDAATLHRSDDGGGVFSDLKAVRHGTLAELVRFVAALPEEERDEYGHTWSGPRLSDVETTVVRCRITGTGRDRETRCEPVLTGSDAIAASRGPVHTASSPAKRDASPEMCATLKRRVEDLVKQGADPDKIPPIPDSCAE